MAGNQPGYLPLKQQSITTPPTIDREWLRKLPKIELHLHLEGSIQPPTLVVLSQRHDAVPLTLKQARALYVYENFVGFLSAFEKVTMRLQTPDDYDLITHEMIHRLAAQGVRHAEVYITFGGILRYRSHLALESVVEAIERGRVRAEAETGTTIFWIIDAVRHFGVDDAAVVFAHAAELRKRYPSIVGIGIGGNESLGPAELFHELYGIAKAAGLRLTAHAGESEPAESIWNALSIGAERIGHALSAINDPELVKQLAKSQTPLELNITSNLRTGVLKSFKDHPVRKYFEHGLFVTLNSDDPPMFGADVLDEYELVQREFAFIEDQMRVFARNSIKASFLPLARKEELLSELELYR